MHRRGLFLGLSLALAVLAGVVFAQSETSLDYEAWSRTALRAEEAVEAGRASNVAMQGLRAELVEWREDFSKAQSVNAKTITAVVAQLNALGPAPDKETEPEEIAAKRQQLNDRLALLKSPGRTAEVALSRANVLISEIDGILRERQAEALMVRGPSPLNPALWGRGWNALGQSVLKTRAELVTAWKNPIQHAALRKNLPVVLLMVAIGSILLLLGRGWMLRLNRRVMARRTTPARWLGAFVLSLGQVILPMIGLVTLIWASFLSGFVGLRVEPLLNEIGSAGIMILVALWLGVRIFPKGVVAHRPLHLPPEKLRQGRLITGLIGLVLALNGILKELARYDDWSDAARAVTFFPLIVLGGVLIWRLGMLLRMHGDAALAQAEEGDEPPRYSERLYRLLGQSLAVLAFIPPLLAALGYLRAAERTMFPLMESLLLLAFVLIVQRVLAELYVLIRRREEARDGLIPVLTGMALIVIAAPRLALIWGMSETQLAELWRQAREGFQLGDTTISPSDFLIFIVVFAAGYAITRLLQGALKTTVLPKTKLDMGARNALVSGIGYVGIFLAALIAITSAGIDLSSLAIVAGALSVGIGFGLRTIVENFVSGIILLIERPISEGDWIEVGGTHGTVRDISVRSTRIETFDRTDVIVPNADLISGTVTNYTRGNTVGRVIVPVGVAYGSDTRRIEGILREIAEAHPMVLAQPAPSVVFQGFGADSLDFEIRAILRDVNWILSVKSDMNHEIARRFVEEGIEIPFSQRDIWIRNPETLFPGGGEAAVPKPAADSATVAVSDIAHMDDADFDQGDGEGGEGGDR
jgi:small-conductance mechanosensitive channel